MSTESEKRCIESHLKEIKSAVENIEIDLQDLRDEAFDEGKEEGLTEGFDDGQKIGYSEGYEKGEQEGYENGKRDSAQ